MDNNNLRITSAAISDRGLSEKRPQNEDSFLEIAASGIFAVADGVGGAQAGEVASQMAVEIIGEAFTNLRPGADAEMVMRTAIERANTAIFQMAQDLPQLASMATTVVALHLDGKIATIGHVGDSRLYRVDPDGEIHRETDDHSMVAEEVRAGRMTEQQAESHPSRNIISRALGAETTVEPDLKTIMIEPGNAFLICSDGITRHVGDPEIKGVLNFGGSPDEICEYLKTLCYQRGAEDNLTAVVIKIAAADVAAHAPAFDAVVDIEEPTVATARPADTDEDDGLLEIETKPLILPPTLHPLESERPIVPAPVTEQLVIPPADEPKTSTEPPSTNGDSSPQPEAFSMFGEQFVEEPEIEKKTNSGGKIATGVAMLLLGCAIGFAAYHFGINLQDEVPLSPALTEMRSANIPLSAFEENRRNVDRDPAAYAGRFGTDPQDSEDFYLLGRAYMLLGDYLNARASFNEARIRLAEADPSNAKILASDIAVGLAVTNDTTIQSILKKELDATRPAPTVNSNVNR